MGFTFLHTADWQIGKPFRMFPANVAGRLEEARLTAIDRLATCARENGARHVLVAGDVYDAPNLPSKNRRQPIERMKRHDDLTFVLLPGNHDPARAGGIWEDVVRSGLPDNIVCLLEPKPFELEPGVVVLPAPLTAKALSGDPSAWMDNARTSDDQILIGLAHGSVRGFGSDDESSVNIDPGRASMAGLAYLALGDWHGKAKINARTWYSGTPEPDRFRDNEPGHCLVVRVGSGNGEPEVSAHHVSQFTWSQLQVTLGGGAALSRLDQDISKLSSDPGRLLLRLDLDGVADGAQALELERWCETWDAKLQYLEVDKSELRTNVDPTDVSAVGDSSELSEAARRLDELAAGDDPVQARVASDALRQLLIFSRAAFDEDRP